MRIQHNIMAMNAYRNYTNNVSAMKANLEKLSSGYKINRAGDDAAGLAISEKMRAQITGLETAQKNAKDGISLVQTAEGALTEVHDMLNRMVELATQSANGTYDNTTDRYQLQKEVTQLKDEINRISKAANFNGIQLLDGSMDGGIGEITLVGADDVAPDMTVVMDGQLANKEAAAGKYSIDFSGARLNNNTTADTSFSFKLDGKTVTVTLGNKAEYEGKALAELIKDAMDKLDTTTDNKFVGDSATYNLSVDGDKLVFEMDAIPTSNTPIDMECQVDQTNFSSVKLTGNAAEQFKVVTEVEAVPKSSRVYGQASFELTAAMAADGQALQIGDEVYVFASKKSTLEKYSGGANVIDMTDLKEDNANYAKIAAARLSTAAQGNTRFKVGANPGDASISITEKEGGVDYDVNNLAGSDGVSLGSGATTANNAQTTDWANLVKKGTAGAAPAPGKALMLQIGDTADDFNQLKVNIKACDTKSIGIDGIDIGTQEGAQKAVDIIKNAINYVSDVRGTLGATQNRLDHTINNLSVMTENIQDAESTIRDTDVAEEMMAYTKNNILIQSAQAMLAQANQVPQGVLQLLQ